MSQTCSGCVTEGDTLSDAVDMAVDAASGWLLDSVENNEPILQASEIKTVIADEYENGFVSLISIDLDDYSNKYGNKAKNTNDPQLAKHHGRARRH